MSDVEQPRDQAAREARLLERLRAGEEAAFADLVRLHLPRFLDDGHQQSPPAAVWDQTAADLLGRAEMQDLVRAAIDTLPQIYRVVLVLRDIEELDTGETAALLDVGLGVVKTRLHRARQALRTIIEQKLQETAA